MPFLIFPMLLWMVVLVGGFTLASRLIRAIERRGSGGGTGETAALQARLVRLEEALEAVTSQMNRLEDGQQFTMRLLEGKSGTAGDVATGRERAIEPADEAGGPVP